MEPICLFPVSGIILRTCFRLFADSDVAFVFLADKLARFCHHIGKALPIWWQNAGKVTCWLVVCWLELCSDIITRVKRYWADSADGFIILWISIRQIRTFRSRIRSKCRVCLLSVCPTALSMFATYRYQRSRWIGADRLDCPCVFRWSLSLLSSSVWLEVIAGIPHRGHRWPVRSCFLRQTCCLSVR